MVKSNLPAKKNKIIVIVGPTASGKSDLGVKIAKKVGGEIISADSRQVYKGMDVGTGKITEKEMAGIPHHLLDVASPAKEFNVSDFKKLAEKKIIEITKRNKIPIIVGGTGFWLDALIYDFNLPEVKPDKKLRLKLEKQTEEELFKKLKKMDPGTAQRIDAKNKRRLVRALEIVIKTKKPIPNLNKENTQYKVLILGIKKPKDVLDKGIYQRLIKRLKQGMITETKKLHKSGVSWKRLEDLGLDYRYASRYLRKQLSYDEMVAQLFKEEKKYAKRQLTWFKKDKNIKWVRSFIEANRMVRFFLFF